MTEQQYRVIADRDKGDDLRGYMGITEIGDRVVMELGRDHIYAPVRIERPVPTTDEFRALLSQPTPTALPPRIEDLAPGTTFIVLREERWTVLPHQVAVQDGHEVGRYLEEFDPSTIRDVTPPKEQS